MMTAKRKRSPFFVILVATAVVFFWRGAWGLMDMFIFPNNQFLSFTTSLIAGIVILVITHMLVDELL